MRRRPLPVRSMRWLVALLCAAVLPTSPGWPAPGAALDDNPLNDRIVDVAVASPGEGGEARLLTVADDVVSAPAGRAARLSILRRTTPAAPRQPGAWTRTFDLAVALGPLGLGTPWLVALAPDRWALLSVAPSRRETVIVAFDLERDDRLRETARLRLDLAVDDAGVADVDGDGRSELVVAETDTRRGRGVCQGSTVRLLDAATLVTTSTVQVPGRSLRNAILAEIDDMPGADLAAYASPGCPAGPDLAHRLSIVVVRLTDGAIVAEAPASSEDPGIGSSLILHAVDIDADGRAELVGRAGEDLVAIEPRHDWRMSPLGPGFEVPLAVWSDATADQHASLVLAGPGHIGHADLVPAPDGIRLAWGAFVQPQDDEVDERWSMTGVSLRRSFARELPPVAWSADMPGSERRAAPCRQVVVALAVLRCTTDGVTGIGPGPAWFATRPLTTLGPSEPERIIVAEAIDWRPERWLSPPTPLAGQRPAGLRHGPSAPFVLSELGFWDVARFDRFPAPRPRVTEPAEGASAELVISAWTGSRVLVRASRLAAPVPASPQDFLELPASPVDTVTLVRAGVPPGYRRGATPGFATVALPDEAGRFASSEHPVIHLLGIDSWGEFSRIVEHSVAPEPRSPMLTVAQPFITAPWPFEAELRGMADPGAAVRTDGGAVVIAEPDGSFVVRAQLPPWPQTVTLRTVDARGNEAVRRASFVGGIDYRQLPWQAILAVLVIGAVIVATVRGRSSIRETSARWDVDEREPTPEIEEISTGH